MSHPTRVRGLKPLPGAQNDADAESHPTRVRGLKRELEAQLKPLEGVAPHAGAWIETGNLKEVVSEFQKSHPTRVRGLKHFPRGQRVHAAVPSHPTRVRGLKLAQSVYIPAQAARRTPRGCVD